MCGVCAWRICVTLSRLCAIQQTTTCGSYMWNHYDVMVWNNTPSWATGLGEGQVLLDSNIYIKWIKYYLWKNRMFVSDILMGSSNVDMMFGRMMFCWVVCMVVGTSVPEDIKLFLCYFVSQPIILHVPWFGTLLLNIVVNKTRSCGIISF